MDAPRLLDSHFLNDHFLIAAPSLHDPNFSRGVTLICQHTAEGAMGLIINRLSEYRLGDVLEQMHIETALPAVAAAPVLLGGPVQPERGFVLHDPGGSWDSTFEVSPQLSLTTSRDILVAMAEGSGPRQAVVALGYAGWTEGQLESELAENAWLTVPADTAIVFRTPIAERWLAAAQLMGVDLRFMTDYSGHA
jgi:putative transcriptional regulator